MRILAAALGLLVATACTAATAAVPTPGPNEDAPLLASEGGVLRPIDNGTRLALRTGYATVRFTPSPQSMDPDLLLSIVDASGNATAADVSVDWESLDMDHGMSTEHSKPVDGGYRTRISFAMPGSWRLVIHVVRGGAEEKLILVLPWVGL
jgi:hypothetical protein